MRRIQKNDSPEFLQQELNRTKLFQNNYKNYPNESTTRAVKAFNQKMRPNIFKIHGIILHI